MLDIHENGQGLRRGKFLVPEEALLEDKANSIGWLWQYIAANVFIARAEYLWSRKAFEYVGVSELFDVVDPRDHTPTYNLFFTSDKNQVVFEREDSIKL